MNSLANIAALTAAVATLCAAGAQAQTSAPALSPSETRINVWSLGGSSGRSDLLRRAAPDGDISGWIDAQDPLVRAMRGQTGWSGVVTALLSLSPEGRVIGCELGAHPAGLAVDATVGLCDRLSAKARYRPALTLLEGAPTADTARFVVRAAAYPRESAATLPVVRAEPLPPSPPVPFVGPGWPPMVGLPPARLSGGLALLEGGGDAPEANASPWAGVEVELDDAGTPTACKAVGTSGDGLFDQQACAAARRATYSLNGATARRDRRVYLLIVRQAGELRALPQSRSERTRPVITGEAAEALAAEWKRRGPWPRVYVSVDASGAVTDCRINESSKIDVLDIAACQMVRRMRGLEPARDVLDRPSLGALFIDRLPEAR